MELLIICIIMVDLHLRVFIFINYRYLFLLVSFFAIFFIQSDIEFINIFSIVTKIVTQ